MKRIEGLISRSDKQVIIFGMKSCPMFWAMKKLLHTVGVDKLITVELKRQEMSVLRTIVQAQAEEVEQPLNNPKAPAIFVSGRYLGDTVSILALHLDGKLVRKLTQLGAISVSSFIYLFFLILYFK